MKISKLFFLGLPLLFSIGFGQNEDKRAASEITDQFKSLSMTKQTIRDNFLSQMDVLRANPNNSEEMQNLISTMKSEIKKVEDMQKELLQKNGIKINSDDAVLKVRIFLEFHGIFLKFYLDLQ